MTITAEPYGHVQIDGESAGPTPIIKRELPAGAHTVVVTRPDTGTVRLNRTIELSDGEHVRLRAP